MYVSYIIPFVNFNYISEEISIKLVGMQYMVQQNYTAHYQFSLLEINV